MYLNHDATEERSHASKYCGDRRVSSFERPVTSSRGGGWHGLSFLTRSEITCSDDQSRRLSIGLVV